MTTSSSASPPVKSHFPDAAGAIALMLLTVVAGFVFGALALLIDDLSRGALPPAVAVGIANVGAFGLAAWAGYRLAGRSLHRTFPFRPVPRAMWTGFVMLLAGLILLAVEGVALLTQILPVGTALNATMLDITIGSGVVGFFVVALIGPVVEELLFRGVILGGLLSHYRARWAIVISAVLFAVAHLNPWQFVPAFGMGLVGGWLFVRTRSLWPCVALHAIHNAIVGFAAVPLLETLGQDPVAYIEQGVLAPLPPWLVALGAVLLAAGIAWVHRVLPSPPRRHAT